MPLYCYMIVERVDYDEEYYYIVAHETEYNPFEFNKICNEIMDKHGKVQEKSSCHDKLGAYWYHIPAQTLIEHLTSEYGFIELDLALFDCTQARRIQGPETAPIYVQYVTESRTCPFG